jgi:phosphoglycolate phosphatase-like HAD superfamily hydrolase
LACWDQPARCYVARVRTLALDFDGVISDSAPEAYRVALRAYSALRPGSALAADRDRAEGAEAGILSADPLYQGFVERMPLGNRAEDFAVVLHSLEHGVPLPDQGAYDRLYAQVESDFLDAFHGRFYHERARFAQDDPAVWRALLAPYPGFVELLHQHAGVVRLAIATAKDRPSVTRLLTDYGLDALFDPALVFDKETGSNKQAHLRALQARLDVPFESITFVDDKVNHLESAAVLGVGCALAAWGYNGQREWKRARSLGFAVCHLENAASVLFQGSD